MDEDIDNEDDDGDDDDNDDEDDDGDDDDSSSQEVATAQPVDNKVRILLFSSVENHDGDFGDVLTCQAS